MIFCFFPILTFWNIYHAKVVIFFEKISLNRNFFRFFLIGEIFFNKKKSYLFLHEKNLYICKPFEVK